MSATVIRTAIVIETLPRARWLAWPFADPDLAQLGSADEDPLLIMALALPEHLKTLSGSEIGHFATPPGTRMDTTVVTVERPDRLGRTGHLARPEHFEMSMPWVATPYGKDLWLHIPPLKLTLRVDDADEIPALVQSEVRRVIAATEPSADDLLRLFPALDYRLEWLELSLERDGKGARSTTAKTIAAREAHALLVTVASAIHADPRVLEGPPLVGRPAELDELDRLIEKHSVLVTGPELAGKSALIEGWIRGRSATPESTTAPAPRPATANSGAAAARPSTSNTPTHAQDLPALLVYATSGARLMAGMSALGQWQERLKRVLQAVATLKAVLWIEHLGELVGGGRDGAELANAFRPWLEDGRVRIVTELRDGEVDRLERQAPALFAVLRRVRLDKLGVSATQHVLNARNDHLHHLDATRPTFDSAGLSEVIALAARYQSQLALPGAAVRLSSDLRALADAEPRSATRATIDALQTQRLYALATGLPLWLLDDKRPYDAAATEATLAKSVVGQAAAVRAVAESLAVIKTRLAARGKPLASFLFAGPTGVGKTELARALAIHLFGSDKRLVRFDMSEFMDAGAAERLIRGSDGLRDGLLTRQLRREPLSIILLDEIEKAHQSVYDILLQALGDGRLTDASGRTASLEGCIVILTSNLGAADRNRQVGLARVTNSETLAQHYLGAIRKHFAPEMVNRIERIIPFAALDAESLRAICRLQVDRVRRRRGLNEIELHVADAALDFIAARGTTADYGARALRRAVEKLLVTPLAHAIARRPVDTIGRVDVQLSGAEPVAPSDRPALVGQQTFEHTPDGLTMSFAARPPLSPTFPLTRVVRLRREARGYLHTDATREVQDRIEQLDADLLRGASPGPVLAERARLDALIAPFRDATADIEQLEDLLFMRERKSRVFPPEVQAELAWAEARVNDLATAAFELLTAIDGRRDHALLALTELDDERAFERWLLPFIEAAEVRRWTVTAWIIGEHAEGAERWPRRAPFGPPRSADDLYVRISERPTDFRHLLLGVSGRQAGTLLACEAGVTTFKPDDEPSASILVDVLSTARSTITADQMLDSELLSPPPLESRVTIAHGAVARTYHAHPTALMGRTLNRTWRRDQSISDYFAHWERHAAHHIKLFDESDEHERSELFDNRFDDEQLLRRLIREEDARRAAETRSGGRP